MKEKKSGTPENARNLLQVRLSENEKRNIKMIAAGQGMTLREAVLAAFTAWAEKLRAQAAAARASKAAGQK
jgi:flavorubredoxin